MALLCLFPTSGGGWQMGEPEMKRKLSTAAVGVATVIGLSAAPAAAYAGESSGIDCGGGQIQTSVNATKDHHHRVNGVNKDFPSNSTSFWVNHYYWLANSGQWTTGTYNGSYDIVWSGGLCY